MRHVRRALSLVVALALAGAAGALALPQQQGSVDLLTQSDGQWDGPGGAQGGSNAGSSVVGLGNIFHTGRAALAIGAPEATPGGRLGAGSVYVVAGQAGTGPVDLTALTGRGYRIDGAAAGDQLGFALAAVTLGNGHPGLAIGAPHANPADRRDAGTVYVIDLARLRQNVDLSLAPLPRPVVGVFTGPVPCAESGYALAAGPPAGRHQPGMALLVGAPGTDAAGCPASRPGGVVGGNTGAAYVVATGAISRRVDLLRPGRAAAVLAGTASGDRTGAAVAAVPGTKQILIGAPYAAPLGRAGAGAVYQLATPGFGHFAFLSASGGTSTVYEGALPNDALGSALTTTRGFARGARRGITSLVFGAPQASPRGRTEAGEVYVLAPRRRGARVDLASVGARVIAGASAGDEAGYALAGIGSINGSGVPSLGIGAPFVNSQTGPGRIDNGAAYVLFGGVGSPKVDLARIGNRGLVAFGARNSDEAGAAVAGVLGENGDGRPALLVGAPYAESAFGATPVVGGATYAIFGYGTPVLRYPRADVIARLGRPIAPLVPVTRRTGGATFSVFPALPPGLTLGRVSGRIAGTPRRPAPLTRYEVEMTDASGIATATLTIAVR